MNGPRRYPTNVYMSSYLRHRTVQYNTGVGSSALARQQNSCTDIGNK